MAEVIRIVIPGVPRALERNRHRIVKRRDGPTFVTNYLPEQSRQEQANIRSIASDTMNGAPPLEGALDLRMMAYLPVPASWSKKKQAEALAGTLRPTGRPDLDNLLKMLADGMKEIVFRDDAQITDAAIWKRYAQRPRLVVEVRHAFAMATGPPPA